MASQQVRASIVCYHCGHTSGEVRAASDAPLTTGVFFRRDAAGEPQPLRGRLVRCLRCNGPTYFEDVQPIRERQPRLVMWRGRGRPPKNAIRIALPPEEGVKRRRPVVLYALVVDGDPSAAAELLDKQAV
jgi:hypothetical protein